MNNKNEYYLEDEKNPKQKFTSDSDEIIFLSNYFFCRASSMVEKKPIEALRFYVKSIFHLKVAKNKDLTSFALNNVANLIFMLVINGRMDYKELLNKYEVFISKIKKFILVDLSIKVLSFLIALSKLNYIKQIY